MRARVIGTAALAAMVSAASGALADEGASKLTLSLRAVPLRAALAEIERGSALRIRVTDGVPDVPVTASLQGVGPETALQALVRSASAPAGGLALTREGAGYLVVRQQGAAPAAAPAVARQAAAPPPVTLTLVDVPLRRAAERLFLKAGLPYTVQDDVPDVPVRIAVRGVSFREALEKMVESGNALEPQLCVALVEDRHVFSISPQSFATVLAPIRRAVRVRNSRPAFPEDAFPEDARPEVAEMAEMAEVAEMGQANPPVVGAGGPAVNYPQPSPGRYFISRGRGFSVSSGHASNLTWQITRPYVPPGRRRNHDRIRAPQPYRGPARPNTPGGNPGRGNGTGNGTANGGTGGGYVVPRNP